MTTSPHTRLGRLADLAFRRRGRMVLAWVALLAAVIALAPLVAADPASDFGTPDSESGRVETLLAQEFPGRTGDVVTVAWESAAGADSPDVRRRVEEFAAAAAPLPGVGEMQAPRVSEDGRVAVAQLTLTQRGFSVPAETGEGLVALAERSSGNGLQIALGGGPVQEAGESGGGPEGFGLMAAALILLIAFGSVVAAGLPLAVAVFGLGISASLVGVLAAFVDVPDFAPAVAGLIGIGVGVDYALLVLTRFRMGLEGGLAVRESVIEAVETAGRSVLIAGMTVLISVNGLFLMGVGYLQGVALATSLAVLVVMAASVSLLPALLSLAGHRVNRLRLPGLGRRPLTGETTVAARWSRVVQRRPVVALVAAVAIIAVLTAPVTGLRLGFPDASNDPAGSTTRVAYDMVTRGFGPGANGPLLLAADVSAETPGPAATAPGAGGDVSAETRGPGAATRGNVSAETSGASVRAPATLDALVDDLESTPGVAFVAPPQVSESGDAALLLVTPTTTPQAAETTDLVHRLRDEVLPGAPMPVMVGGTAAALVDQSELVAARLPLFIAGVVGMSFLLLLCAFRSPLIALKAGAMNLLSVGAAYGVIALFASGGWAGELIGIDTETPIAPFIPVMMFAILFGLSMDYEVFLLSRVREEYLRHGDTTRAVSEGLAKTARVITAAAAIMVAVFLAFVTSSTVFLKLLGLGMSTAILVDATIVRMVLVPALMQLVGRANWWIPSWLDRALPRLAPEGPR